MDPKLLAILVCPLCKGGLKHDRLHRTLDCAADDLAFPIRDGVPVLLEPEAVPIADKHTLNPSQPTPSR